MGESKFQQAAKAPPITDSPWLWFALFTGCGLAALVATGGKFGKRQANIEHQYQARAAVASGRLQVEQTGGGEMRTTGALHYTTPDDTAVPIWPLELILGVLCAASFYMLLRERIGARPPAAGAMTTILENPLPTIVVGGLAATMALIVFLARRNGASLAALASVVGVTLLLVLVERFVVTDREQVENALDGVLDAIDANDVAAAFDYIDPAAARSAATRRRLCRSSKWKPPTPRAWR